VPTPDALAEIASRHQVQLERLKAGYVGAFEDFLREMERDLLRQIRSIDDMASLRGRRLRSVLKVVRGTIKEGFGNYEKVWRKQLAELGEYEAGFEARALGEVVDYDFTLPSPNQIMDAAFARPLSVKGADEGKLLEPFFRDWTGRTYQRVEGAIRLGAAEGQTTQQVVRRLMGTKARKYADGLLDMTRRDVELMARTSLQHMAATAKEQTWQSNEDVIKGVEWVSVLDSRTSVQCRSLDGREFPLDKGPRPPLHIACRSTTAAVFKGKLDLLRGGGSQSARGPDGKVNRVSADLSYYDWLKKQPKGFQDSILGAERGKLLRDGGLTAKRFAELQLNKHFQPITLAEMRKIEPAAFAMAGI
jgi:SPP1 gp7 family putative phage head morphogenesis protein